MKTRMVTHGPGHGKRDAMRLASKEVVGLDEEEELRLVGEAVKTYTQSKRRLLKQMRRPFPSLRLKLTLRLTCLRLPAGLPGMKVMNLLCLKRTWRSLPCCCRSNLGMRITRWVMLVLSALMASYGLNRGRVLRRKGALSMFNTGLPSRQS